MRLKDIKIIPNLGRVSVILILLTIMMGMCALMLLFSINKAGEKEILEGMKKVGNTCLLSLDSNFLNKEGKELGRLSLSDIILIKNRVLEIDKIALLNSNNIYSVKVGKREYPEAGESFAIVPLVSGVTPEFRKVMNIKLKEGRFINKTDIDYKRRVCVVGSRLYERLRERKIIGKKLMTKVDEGGEEISKFTIVGVLQKKIPLFASVPDKLFCVTAPLLFPSFDERTNFSKAGKILGTYQTLMLNLPINDSVFISWTVFNEKELSSSLPPYTSILIKIKIPEDIGKFVKDEEMFSLFKATSESPHHAEDAILYYLPEKVKNICDKIRHVLKGKWGKDKIFVFLYSGNLIDEINVQTNVSNKVMIIIALSSLLLSSIILSSMMLISVNKRVSEIGIRRAYGARKRDIFLQFLLEGVMLYAIGISMGSGVGILSSYLVVNKILLWEFSMPIYGIMMSSIFVFLVGILSSIYPAMKAANVPPGEALKWE